jgi:hypothetical protein
MDGSSASSICGLAKIHWNERRGAKSCSAIVFEQQSHTIRVATTASLPLFSRVRLTVGGLEYIAQVESVEATDQGSEAELALQEARRIDERMDHHADLQMRRTGSEAAYAVTVQATNYSNGGFQVSSAAPFPQNEPVHLTTDGIEYFGITRYCHRAATGHLIGIELVEPPTFTSVR